MANNTLTQQDLQGVFPTEEELSSVKFTSPLPALMPSEIASGISQKDATKIESLYDPLYAALQSGIDASGAHTSIRNAPQTIVGPLKPRVDNNNSIQKALADALEVAQPQFMPFSAAFESTDMFKRIKNRLPVIDVFQLQPETITETLIDSIKSLFANAGEFDAGKNLTNEQIAAVFSKVGKTTYGGATQSGKYTPPNEWWLSGNDNSDSPLTIALYLLFMTFTSKAIHRYKFPIMASPNLTIKTGTGWEKSTSLFPLINKLGSSFGSATGGVANLITSALTYMGQDIGIGPLFSTKDVHGDNPTFSSKTFFINDSKKAAKNNKQILQQLMIGALPGASGYLNIKPGNLFNVSVNIGLGDDDNANETAIVPLKKLFLCTGNFTVQAHGIYRDGVTPEAYELTTEFASLLPDLINMQLLDFTTTSAKGTQLLWLN